MRRAWKWQPGKLEPSGVCGRLRTGSDQLQQPGFCWGPGWGLVGRLGAGPLHMEPWLATLTHCFSVFLREDLQWSPFLLTPYLLLTISSHLHIRTCGLTVSALFMDIEYRRLLLGKEMKCHLSVERLSLVSRPVPCTVIRVGSRSEVWAATLLDRAEQLCFAVVL